MRTVNIAELKNRLSTYITYAKAGEDVIIRDRNKPVARLVPFVANDVTEQELALVAKGIMRLPLDSFDVDAYLDVPITLPAGSNLGSSSLTQALLDERSEGR